MVRGRGASRLLRFLGIFLETPTPALPHKGDAPCEGEGVGARLNRCALFHLPLVGRAASKRVSA